MILVAFAIGIGIAAGFFATLMVVSRSDVMIKIASIDKNANVVSPRLRLDFGGMRVSASHGIYVEYVVVEHELWSRAYWRLLPFRRVELTK